MFSMKAWRHSWLASAAWFETKKLNHFKAHNQVSKEISIPELELRARSGDRSAQVQAAVKTFSKFESGNDPRNEHDFGSVEVEGQTYFSRSTTTTWTSAKSN